MMTPNMTLAFTFKIQKFKTIKLQQGRTIEDPKVLFFPYAPSTTNTNYNTKTMPETRFKRHREGGKALFAKIFSILIPINALECIIAICWALGSVFSGITRRIGSGTYPTCVIVSSDKGIGKSRLQKMLLWMCGQKVAHSERCSDTWLTDVKAVIST